MVDRIAKFKRQAPKIQTQAHFDRILLSFEKENRAIAIESVSGILPSSLKAREPEELPIVIKRDPPIGGVTEQMILESVTEHTAMRLTAQREQILAQQATIKDQSMEIESLRKRESELVELLAQSTSKEKP